MSVTDLDKQIKAAKGIIAESTKLLERLEAERKRMSIPPKPPICSALDVSVSFKTNQHVSYRFLIAHVPSKGYYTTGTMPGNKHFPTWEALIEYFHGDDVVTCSPFTKLDISTTEYGERIDRRLSSPWTVR